MAKQAKIKGDGRSVGNDKKLKTTLTITFSIISIVYEICLVFIYYHNCIYDPDFIVYIYGSLVYCSCQ